MPYNRCAMLETAIEAAAEAGKLLRKNFGSTLHVNQATHHDIKLEIDEQAQRAITKVILADFPDHCILGEEGVTGNPNADARWVVDPLDGTVNYFYGIPHYAVSIAAQVKSGADWETVAGVVLAPEIDELFVTEKGQPAMLHGQPIHVSERTELSEAIVCDRLFQEHRDDQSRSPGFRADHPQGAQDSADGRGGVGRGVRGVRPVRRVHRVRRQVVGHRRRPAHSRKRRWARREQTHERPDRV